MRTTSFAPPFPEDLGTWLASFRHRTVNDRGNPMSPEKLGAMIGVSGATVRRWESGRLRPGPEDATNLARACNLTSMQSAFLSRALRNNPPSETIDEASFVERAEHILRAEYPVYIMDSMMYIRAWNSYLPRFLRRDWRANENEYHLIDFIVEAEQHAGIQPMLRERVWRAILEFWYITADSCGTEEYRRLVRRLSQYEVFREEWQRIAFLNEGDCHQIGLPRRAWRHDIGAMLICPFVVLMPPLYQVRQFMPVDTLAQETLDKLRSEGPPEVFYSPRPHWSSPILNEGAA